jgi:hypothetical protein
MKFNCKVELQGAMWGRAGLLLFPVFLIEPHQRSTVWFFVTDAHPPPVLIRPPPGLLGEVHTYGS